MPNIRSSLVLLVLIAALLVPALSFGEGAGDQPFKAAWPAGWVTTTLHSPPTDGEKDLGGQRVRSLKRNGEAVEAAIEVLYIPRSDGGRATIDEELASTREIMASGYARQKLQPTFSALFSLDVDGHPAKRMDISVTTPNGGLKQILIVTMTERYVYSLTFSATPENFARIYPEFERFLSGISLR